MKTFILSLILSLSLFSDSQKAPITDEHKNKKTMPVTISTEIIENNSSNLFENFVLASPAQLQHSIQKLKINNISGFINTKTKSIYPSTKKYTLVMGVLTSDLFLYIGDKKQEKIYETLNKIILISKKMNLGDEFRNNLISFKPQLVKQDWRGLIKKMARSHLKLTQKYQADYREDLVLLINLSAWIEGADVLARAIESNYSKERTYILHQPITILYLLSIIEQNQEALKMKEVQNAKNSLLELMKITDKAKDRQFSKKQVKEISRIISALKQDLLK